jgi:hypothetical protein
MKPLPTLVGLCRRGGLFEQGGLLCVSKTVPAFFLVDSILVSPIDFHRKTRKILGNFSIPSPKPPSPIWGLGDWAQFKYCRLLHV